MYKTMTRKFNYIEKFMTIVNNKNYDNNNNILTNRKRDKKN